MKVVIYIICSVFSSIQCGVLEKQSDRVMHGKSLSERANDDSDDYDYDHDAFLGEEEADLFDSLTPEESQRRLGLIVDQIDKDKNGLVELVELQKWIQYVQEREIREDTERQWEERNKVIHSGDNNHITWESYKKDIYGFVDETEESGFNFLPMMMRDKRRWEAADRDQDQRLTKIEFQSFLHPEDAEYMRHILVIEVLEDMDTDKDGKLSIDEYISDLYKGDQGDAEPDWVNEERKMFRLERDSDGDGFMNKDELQKWIVPDDIDHSKSEAKHLIARADVNSDGLLTKEEILDQYDLFVGSSATQFGEVLSRHDEF